MPTVPFTIIIVNSAPIQVYGVNVSYEEILNSFGSYWYLLEKIFIQSLSNEQANQPLSFEKFDSDGRQTVQVSSPAVDVYQSQPNLLVDMEQFHVIVDGRLIMSFDILPSSTTLRFTFFTKRGYISDFLNEFGRPNNKMINV